MLIELVFGLVHGFNPYGLVLASEPEGQAEVVEGPVMRVPELNKGCVPIVTTSMGAREAEAEDFTTELGQEELDLVVVQQACTGQAEAEHTRSSGHPPDEGSCKGMDPVTQALVTCDEQDGVLTWACNVQVMRVVAEFDVDCAQNVRLWFTPRSG